MMKWMTRGIMPSEEDVFKKRPKQTKSNEHAAHFQAEEHLELEDSDFKAMCIAMAQVFFPVVMSFVGVYILVILFITKVWLK